MKRVLLECGGRSVLLVAMLALSGESFSQVAPMSTITHPLSIGRHSMAALTDAEAGNIIALGSQVLSQCNATFRQQGPVTVVGTPSTVNSDADMAAACNSAHIASDGGFEPLGVPRRVRVVNAINWCGNAGGGIIGCAYTPGQCMVVVRYSSSMEGILWAHEFGHSKGLPHRTDSGNAVMYPSIGGTHTVFTGQECAAIRQLGFYAQITSEEANLSRVMSKAPIEDFVAQAFVHGVPYDEARLYSSADVAKVLPWLSDTGKMDYWANIASTVGIVADRGAYTVLTSMIGASGSGTIPVADYRGRVSAIMALGYAVRGSNDQQARDFLEKHSSPSDWSGTKWQAPYHANTAERDADLASAAVLGLSLANDTSARQFLEGVARRFVGDSIYERALRQAIADSNRELEKREFPVRR